MDEFVVSSNVLIIIKNNTTMMQLSYKFNYYFLIAILPLYFMTTMGCSTLDCEPDFFTYDVEVNYSLDKNEVELDSSFNLNFIVPNTLSSNEGVNTDLSDVDFRFDILLKKYNDDDDFNLFAFEDAWSNFQLESYSEIESGKISFEELSTENGREFSIKLTPLVRGAFVLSIDALIKKEDGADSCTPLNLVRLINNQLSMAEEFSNITSKEPKVKLGEETEGLLIFEVN